MEDAIVLVQLQAQKGWGGGGGGFEAIRFSKLFFFNKIIVFFLN
jgi:hypothetical protein